MTGMTRVAIPAIPVRTVNCHGLRATIIEGPDGIDQGGV